MAGNRIKILFIMPNLACGGAEKIIVTILQNIDSNRFSVKLALLNKAGKNVVNVPKDIPIYNLNVRRVSFSIFKLLKLLWQEKPDIIFSGAGHLSLLIAIIRPLLPQKSKYVARETSIPSIRNSNAKLLGFIFDCLYKTVLTRFDKIICQSNYMRQDLQRHYNIPSEKLLIINNPVDVNAISKKTSIQEVMLPEQTSNILAVGRLDKEKGYDLILQALQYSKGNITLTIIGDGSEQANLKNLVVQYNLVNKVRFLGVVDNPYPYMLQANLLVSGSRYEGFPNAVLEAHACGIPVLAFDCPGGMAEIIIAGVNGKLIKMHDCIAFGEAIDEMLATHWNRDNIVKSVRSRYDCSLIIPQYERILEDLQL